MPDVSSDSARYGLCRRVYTRLLGERGESLVEYALILLLVAVMFMLIINGFDRGPKLLTDIKAAAGR